MKKRLVLSAAAVLLAVSLAIGGTLMLFTATSGPAKNVINLSDGIKGALLENGGDETNSDYWQVGEEYDKDGEGEGVAEKFNGIDFGSVQPNQKLTKAPKVSRKVVVEGPNAAEAYVAVRAEILTNFDEISGDLPDDSTIDATAVDALINQIAITYVNENEDGTVTITDFGDDWVFCPDSAGSKNGWYFHVDNDDKLTTLATGSETGDIFNTVTIPNYTGEDMDLFATLGSLGLEITIKLEAYLVQADHNPYNELDDETGKTGYAAYATAFSADFNTAEVTVFAPAAA
jgi:hypothetical protein